MKNTLCRKLNTHKLKKEQIREYLKILEHQQCDCWNKMFSKKIERYRKRSAPKVVQNDKEMEILKKGEKDLKDET